MKIVLMITMFIMMATSLALPAYADKQKVTSADKSEAYNPLGKMEIEYSRKLIRDHRDGMVLLDLKISGEEEKRFEPVYKEYRKVIRANGNKLFSLIGEYAAAQKDGTLSDAQALKMTKLFMDIQIEKLELKKTYISKFKKILPGIKVGRFYQIDHRLDIADYLEISDAVPLAK